MGCDIHVYAEAFVRHYDHSTTPPTEKWHWVSADPWGFYDARRALHSTEVPDPKYVGLTTWTIDHVTVPDAFRLYSGRHYGFFAALNGVRDYDGITPYFPEGRPYPADLSENLVREIREYGADAHSPCWATLAELRKMREWAAHERVLAWGVVPESTLDTLRAEGYIFTDEPAADPHTHMFGAFRAQRVVMSNKPLDAYARGYSGLGVEVRWEQKLSEYVGRGLDSMIAGLDYRKRQFNVESDEHVRAVWFYDN